MIMKREFVGILCCLWLLSWVGFSDAMAEPAPSFGGIAKNMMDPVIGVISIVRAISITAGIGLVLSSFSKFADHRRNRHEISLATVFSIFVAGVCLIIVGFIPFRGE